MTPDAYVLLGIYRLVAAMFSMAYWSAYALINYGWAFMMFSISHRWLMCSAWLMLGVVLGKATKK